MVAPNCLAAAPIKRTYEQIRTVLDMYWLHSGRGGASDIWLRHQGLCESADRAGRYKRQRARRQNQ